MVKEIISHVAREFEAGYDFTITWTAYEVNDSEYGRLARACAWGWYGLLEAVSDAMHPDGPR